MLPYVTLIHILVARGITFLLDENRWLDAKGWVPGAGMAVIALSLIVSSGLLTSRVSLYRELTKSPSPRLTSVRAAGGWLAERTNDPDNLAIVGVGYGCGEMMMYYASGGGKPTGTFIPITLGMTLDEAAGLVREGTADFMVLTRECGRPFTAEIVRVWNDPELAHEFGLGLAHRDDQGLFQVYTSRAQQGRRFRAPRPYSAGRASS
jgi:hypothetical protein